MQPLQVEIAHVDQAVAPDRSDPKFHQVIEKSIGFRLRRLVLLIAPLNLKSSESEPPLDRHPERARFERRLNTFEPREFLDDEFLNPELRNLVKCTPNRSVMNQVRFRRLLVSPLNFGSFLYEPKQRAREDATMTILEMIWYPSKGGTLRWTTSHMLAEDMF